MYLYWITYVRRNCMTEKKIGCALYSVYPSVSLSACYQLANDSLTKNVDNFPKQMNAYITTVITTKSDCDVILCLQLLSKTLTCTLHLS